VFVVLIGGTLNRHTKLGQFRDRTQPEATRVRIQPMSNSDQTKHLATPETEIRTNKSHFCGLWL